MASWWKSRTKTGRVVYDRKKHPFSWRDVNRILDPLEPATSDSDAGIWFRLAVIGILEKAAELPEIDQKARFAAQNSIVLVLDQLAAFPGFGGGKAGGAGATGTFSPFDIGPCGVPYFLMPFQSHCE